MSGPASSARNPLPGEPQAKPHGLPVWVSRPASLLIVGVLAVQHGFPLSPEADSWLNRTDLALACLLAVDLLAALRHRNAYELRRAEYLVALVTTLLLLVSWLPGLSLVAILHFFHLDTVENLRTTLVHGFLLFSLCLRALGAMQTLFHRGTRPEMILAGSFATLIGIGSLMLLLPNSSASLENPIRPMDALFTSTSAVCVTGLAVRDTGSEFSHFGQMVIMALFQTGGLGLVTFVAFLSIFSSRSLPVPQMVAFGQLVNAPKLSDLKRQIVGILLATIIIELIGAGFLYQFAPEVGDPLNRLQWSAFHSVSAFCNAGFALQGDSVTAYQGNAGIMFTLMGLIVLGGLGFPVIAELLGHRYTRAPFFRRFGIFRRIHAGKAPHRLSLQTKLSLTVTGGLLVAGFAAFWLLELPHLLQEESWGDGLLIAAFQSVTARTAGFNSIPIGEMQDASQVFMMFLMVVGASPISMGGGIKAVTFGILLLTLRSMVTRRDRVEVFHRTIPVSTLFAAVSVFVLYIMAAAVGVFLLAVFDPELRFQDQLFEVISALSTVGLSTGITTQLSVPSQLVLCVAMFLGRVGPLAMVLAVFQNRRSRPYQYPEEKLVVG